MLRPRVCSCSRVAIRPSPRLASTWASAARRTPVVLHQRPSSRGRHNKLACFVASTVKKESSVADGRLDRFWPSVLPKTQQPTCIGAEGVPEDDAFRVLTGSGGPATAMAHGVVGKMPFRGRPLFSWPAAHSCGLAAVRLPSWLSPAFDGTPGVWRQRNGSHGQCAKFVRPQSALLGLPCSEAWPAREDLPRSNADWARCSPSPMGLQRKS